MALNITTVATEPFEGQKPGTSGLRKKTKLVSQGNYLQNFIQATFDALPSEELAGSTLVVSGDGRYYNDVAIQIIIKMAAANGVGRIWIGLNGLMSTPCVSEIIRTREGGIAYGGIILTASHNPGGPDDDFGIKYNIQNGGPAPESVTSAIFAQTKTISEYKICADLPDVDLATVGVTQFDGFSVEVLDSTQSYIALVQRLFDVDALKALLARPDFSFVYDSMHGVAGPYATSVLSQLLGVPAENLLNCTPLPDFGGGHPDPNLTYAHDLVERMGLTREGTPLEGADPAAVPDMGAAADGDADRNMILGKQFFVTPSDSVAVIAANAAAIPFFKQAGGLRAVARSMPTSGALDRVASALGIQLFEVPTGWKFFGNLMDSGVLGKTDYNPLVCGEESFGTGSNHVREKDGLWAVLCWLSILADKNKDTAEGSLVTVEDIVREHWARFGRNYYCRYDYEGVDKAAAQQMMARLVGMIDMFNAANTAAAAAGDGDGESKQAAGPGVALGAGFTLAAADEFEYTDPVDGSVSSHQGIRFIFSDGSRLIFRLSGTGSVGATIRMYLEKYETEELNKTTADALGPLVKLALSVSKLEEFTGRSEPTVIT